MFRPLNPEQVVALRALREGSPPTFPLLAAAGRVNVSTVRQRASTERWDKVNYLSAAAVEAREALNAAARGRMVAAEGDAFSDSFTDQLPTPGEEASRDGLGFADNDPVELLAQASGFVARQVTRLMQHADRRGGRLDKAQVDGLAALARMMERWETLAHERAVKEEQDSDDDLADALRWINDRIVELAREEAGRLVAAGYGAQDGEARP